MPEININQAVLVIVILLVGIIAGYLLSGTQKQTQVAPVNQPSSLDKNFFYSLAQQSISLSDWCIRSGGFWYVDTKKAQIQVSEQAAANYQKLGFNVLDQNGSKFVQTAVVSRVCIVPTK